MSYIEQPESYRSLGRVFLITKDFDVKYIGVYDPLWEIVSSSYVSGRLVDSNGNKYDDSDYHGKNSTIMRFDHYFLGNTNIGRRIGNPHEHTKELVSTNHIELDEVRVIEKNRDVFYYADLVKEPFVVNGGEYTLYELEPHLNPEELATVTTDVNTVAKMKNKLSIALENERRTTAELFLANASVNAANAHVKTLNSYVRQFKTQLDAISEEAIKVGFIESELALKMTRDIEKKFNLEMDWRQTMKNAMIGDVGSKAQNVSKFFANFDEYKNDKSLTNEMKDYMVEVVLDICGVDFVRMKVNEYEQKGGLTNNTLTGNNLQIMKAKEEGIIGDERATEAINSVIQVAQSEYGKTGNIELAVTNALQKIPFGDKISQHEIMKRIG